MAEEEITFAVLYLSSTEYLTERIKLFEYDTVELLKIEIHKIFNIPPHRQLIDGWKCLPEDDQTVLQLCSNVNHINYLSVRVLDTNEKYFDNDMTSDNIYNMAFDRNKTEIEAAQTCFKKICSSLSTSHIKFNAVSLSQAIEQALLTSVEKRKGLLLYLHNSEESFSTQFLRILNHEDISEIMSESFYFIGWDVQNKHYHNSLCKALTDAGLEHLTSFIDESMAAAVIIQNIHGNIKIMAALVGDIKESDFLIHINNSKDFLKTDKQEAIENANERSEQTEIDSTEFQKMMADRLGDRDYTCYAFNQHDLLKKNIGYALFGPPQKETGYDEKETEKIEKIYTVINEKNEKITEFKGQVELSCIFNCTEPLPKEKRSRKKKNPAYNPNTDIMPVPIFILRKCRGSHNPCRIFIDDIGRKYESWTDYIEENKLGKCIMVLPQNGRYKVKDDQLLLERHESPECSVVKKILQVGDIAGMVGGLGSGGVMLAAGAATLTTVVVAPAALITAGVVGATAGVYSLGRSIGHLVDKVKHDESLSLANSEARAIYFNLLAGSLGFVGAGANVAVSQLVARGVNIGKGFGVVVNTIGVANIGVSGASIVNSGYDVFDQWINQNQTPSLLTLVQLSSSVLFFGNAVYSFKTCQTIIDETQAKVIQDYSESLRSNRHRKTFNKMMKETIRQNDSNQVRGRAEVIKTINSIANKDEVFAVLTRTNKMMNKKGVKFFATNGEVTLNGQTVNMNEFIIMNKQEASAFLSNLPTKTDISQSDTTKMINTFSLDTWSLPNVQQFAQYAYRLIGAFGTDIQGMLFQIAHDIMSIIMLNFKNIISEIFPDDSLCIKVVCMLMEYFGGKAWEFLMDYRKWRKTGSHYYYKSDFAEMPASRTDQYMWIFVKFVKICFSNGHIREYELLEVIKFAESYVVNEVYEYKKKQEEIEERDKHSPQKPKKIQCKICSGHYFSTVSGA